jgi:hypothetical protein
MAHWEKRRLKIAPHHGWRAKPGHKVFVADRGAVRFDVPDDWIIKPAEQSCVFKDAGDNCVLEVSHWRLPPVDLSGLSVMKLLLDMEDKQGHPVTPEEIMRVERPDLELVWAEHNFLDPVEKRIAVGRTCLARGGNVQVLITFAFWPEDRDRFTPAWDEVLRSLQLGNYFADPRVGPRLH